MFRYIVKEIDEKKFGPIISRFLIFKKMLLIYESEGLDLNPDSSLTRCLTTVKLCHLCCLICNEAASPEELKSPFQLWNLDSLETGMMLKHRSSYWVLGKAFLTWNS